MFLILFQGFLSLLVLFSGIYILFIGPVLFRYWIIPKITRRFDNVCELDYASLTIEMAGPHWPLPSFEISWYIICSYMQWDKAIKRYHNGPGIFFKNIHYNISQATKAEIVMSFVTLSILSMMVICMIALISLDQLFGVP